MVQILLFITVSAFAITTNQLIGALAQQTTTCLDFGCQGMEMCQDAAPCSCDADVCGCVKLNGVDPTCLCPTDRQGEKCDDQADDSVDVCQRNTEYVNVGLNLLSRWVNSNGMLHTNGTLCQGAQDVAYFNYGKLAGVTDSIEEQIRLEGTAPMIIQWEMIRNCTFYNFYLEMGQRVPTAQELIDDQEECQRFYNKAECCQKPVNKNGAGRVMAALLSIATTATTAILVMKTLSNNPQII